MLFLLMVFSIILVWVIFGCGWVWVFLLFLGLVFVIVVVFE